VSAYVTKPISTCERVSRALSALLSELHFPTRALGPITEARDLLLRAALDANEFYSTERDELTRDVVKLRADLAAAVAKRNEWAGGAARLSSQLGNLLAVIHRDGGHYEAEHGTEKACADAMQRICDTRARLGAADELAMLVRRLARALQKAAPDSDLPKTAMDYLSIAGLAGSPMRRDE